jgi:hypothetical protein
MLRDAAAADPMGAGLQEVVSQLLAPHVAHFCVTHFCALRSSMRDNLRAWISHRVNVNEMVFMMSTEAWRLHVSACCMLHVWVCVCMSECAAALLAQALPLLTIIDASKLPFQNYDKKRRKTTPAVVLNNNLLIRYSRPPGRLPAGTVIKK